MCLSVLFCFFIFLFVITVIIVAAFTKRKKGNTKTLAFVRNKDRIALLVQQPVEQSATLLPHYYGDCCGVVYIYGGAEQSQTFATLIIIFTFPSFLFIIISSFFLSVFCFFFGPIKIYVRFIYHGLLLYHAYLLFFFFKSLLLFLCFTKYPGEVLLFSVVTMQNCVSPSTPAFYCCAVLS